MPYFHILHSNSTAILRLYIVINYAILWSNGEKTIFKFKQYLNCSVWSWLLLDDCLVCVDSLVVFAASLVSLGSYYYLHTTRFCACTHVMEYFVFDYWSCVQSCQFSSCVLSLYSRGLNHHIPDRSLDDQAKSI